MTDLEPGYCGDKCDGPPFKCSQYCTDTSSLSSSGTTIIPDPPLGKGTHQPISTPASLASTSNSAIFFTSVPTELPISSGIITDSSPPTPSTVISATTITPTATQLPASTTPNSTSTSHGLSGGKIAAILAPILFVVVIVPILYLCFLCWRNKRHRQRLPELRLPHETTLLRSRDNSILMVSPFSDNERARSDSVGTYDRPSIEDSPRPPPVLPAPSLPTCHTQESWPLTGILPDPPPAYDRQASSLRPPSSVHSKVSGRSRADSSADSGVSPLDVENPFLNRTSDAVSELSFDHGSRSRRTRDLDELSLVSAMESDYSAERDSHHII